MDISVSQAQDRLSQVLEDVQKEPITITRHGEPVAVILSYEEYRHLSEVKAYLKILSLSQQLDNRGVTAAELARASREELGTGT
jgi:prevent-host-death family protein